LGVRDFKAACVEVCVDNGGGMIKGKTSFYQNLKTSMPDLPAPWGNEHHLARIHIRACKMPNVQILGAQLEIVNSIVKYHASPKRYWYFAGQAQFFKVPFKPMDVVAEQRWVPSSRNLMEDVVFNLPALRLCTDQMIKSEYWKQQRKPAESQEKLLGFREALQSHVFLMSVHIWADFLQIEGWASKMSQFGTADLLTCFAMLSKLPGKLRHFVNTTEQAGGFQAQYRESITRTLTADDPVPTFTIVAYTKNSRLDDYPHIGANGKAAPRPDAPISEVKTVELVDYAATHRVVMSERQALAQNVLSLVEMEMPVTAELSAFNTVFNSKEYKIASLKIEHCFSAAAKELVKPFLGGQRFPAWVLAALPVQLEAYRRMLISEPVWLTRMKQLTPVDFWLKVRACPDKRYSVLLYFRKICRVRDMLAANVEQFISRLNRVFDDRTRRGLNTDAAEDVLRIAYNGPDPSAFMPETSLDHFMLAFGHVPVKSKAAKDESLKVNAKDNARRRTVYAANAEFRAEKQKVERERHRILFETKAKGRGSIITTVAARTGRSERAAMAEEAADEDEPEPVLTKCMANNCKKWVFLVPGQKAECASGCSSSKCGFCEKRVCICPRNCDDCGKKFQVCTCQDEE
jgi:hypothetical protein